MPYFLRICVLIILSFTISSCSLIIRQIGGIHDPIVESQESLKQMIDEAGCKYDYSYTLHSETDSTAIFQNLFLCVANKILLFDSYGHKLCYENEDSVSCSGNLYKKAFDNPDSSFKLCMDDSIRLDDYLHKFESIVSLNPPFQLEDSAYYLIYYWSKFIGGKKGYKENLQWLTEMQDSSRFKIYILGVNTDLQETWGLEEGKKLKMKLKVSGRGGTAEFGPIPYKKSIMVML